MLDLGLLDRYFNVPIFPLLFPFFFFFCCFVVCFLLLSSYLLGESLKFIFQTFFEGKKFHFGYCIAVSKGSLVSSRCSFLIFSCSCFSNTIPSQISLRISIIALKKNLLQAPISLCSLFFGFVSVMVGALPQCQLDLPVYSCF